MHYKCEQNNTAELFYTFHDLMTTYVSKQRRYKTRFLPALPTPTRHNLKQRSREHHGQNKWLRALWGVSSPLFSLSGGDLLLNLPPLLTKLFDHGLEWDQLSRIPRRITSSYSEGFWVNAVLNH